MSQYIENTNHFAPNDPRTEESSFQINQSSVLDELAAKLSDICLATNATTSLSKEEYNKARMSDIINAMGALFTLFRVANNRPVYLITQRWDWREVNGYYFFIGSHEEIKQNLQKLSENEDNLLKKWYDR